MKALSLLPVSFFLTAGALTVAGQAETKNPPDKAAAPADETKPESELHSTGLAFSVEDQTILLTPENVKIPLEFVRTTDTTLVDESGKSVGWDQIRKGIPMTVQYATLGEKMVATKVVVTRYMLEGGKEVAAVDEDGKKRAELALIKHVKEVEAADKTKAVPATAGGTIMGFEQVIAVGDGNGGDVTQYVVNNSTQYVTPSGKPVAPGLVRTGGRVDVKYVENNGRKIATQMILYGVPGQSGTMTQISNGGQNGGTAAGRSSSSSGTAANGSTVTATTNPSSGGGTTTAWVDQFGNIIPGTLETGFINPPVSVLPPANTRAGANFTAGAGSGNAANGTNTTNGTNGTAGTVATNPQQPASTAVPATTRQPGTPQPNTTQPAATQPTTQPATAPAQPTTPQPGTRQPATRPAGTPSTGSRSSPAPATPPAAAPGR